MRIPCALFVVCAVAGCTSGGSEAAERHTDSTARRDSIAAVAAAAMDEPQVIGLLEHVHAADSALGALGALKGSATEVKEFGRMISREHRALRGEGAALARHSGITPTQPTVPPDAPQSAMAERLTTAPAGPVWDQMYVEHAMAMHESSMENLARALAATRNDSTRQLIKRSVPIIQKHLDKAKSLRRALQQAQDTTSRTP
jgi:putative membrane protein